MPKRKKVLELDNAASTSNIASPLLWRRLNLWTSANGSSRKTSRLWRSNLIFTTGKSHPVSLKNWMQQFQNDAKEVFGSNAVTTEWIKDPSNKWPKTDLTNVKPKLLRTRERNVTCLDSECHRMFATIKEMNRYTRTPHNTSANITIEEESKPYLCPITSCNMHYCTKGCFTRNIAHCHQVFVEASPPTRTAETPTNKHNTTVSAPTPALATAKSQFKFHYLPKILPTNKRTVNYCYTKHRHSVIKRNALKN